MTVARSELHAGAVSDDSRAGLAMFLIFTAAVLIVTGAVALVALVGGWWMLAVAFAIHVLMTTLVVATIAFVMDGPTSAATERQPAADRRGESRSPAASKPLAAL